MKLEGPSPAPGPPCSGPQGPSVKCSRNQEVLCSFDGFQVLHESGPGSQVPCVGNAIWSGSMSSFYATPQLCTGDCSLDLVFIGKSSHGFWSCSQRGVDHSVLNFSLLGAKDNQLLIIFVNGEEARV